MIDIDKIELLKIKKDIYDYYIINNDLIKIQTYC